MQTMPYLIVSIAIQVAVVIHIVRTGRSMMWIFIVLFFPLIGILVYFFLEILPELMQGRMARTTRRSLEKAIDPDRELKLAEQNLEAADTVQNATALAEQYLERGLFAEARDLYRRHLTGVYADDPLLLQGLARAQFGLREFGEAELTLSTLIGTSGDFRSPEVHLLYARVQEELGNRTQARAEYEALCARETGPEAMCRLAALLKAEGEAARAEDLFRAVVKKSRAAGRHYNELYKDWVALARREVG